jgi:hypothetical protein
MGGVQRWAIGGAVAAVAAVAAAAVLSGVGVGGASKPPAARAPAADAPPAVTLPGLELADERPPAPGSIPAQLADPSTPPDVRAAAAVSAQWSLLARRLRHSAEAPPEWRQLEQETTAVSDAIKALRAAPTPGSWDALVVRQRALIPQLRGAGMDDGMSAALDAIEASLASPPTAP